MNRISASSIGASSRYAVIAVNVSRVISNSSGRSLNEPEKILINRASDLLDKIVQGSKFIEQREAHALSDPHENFLAFDHAMSALRKLNLNSDAKGGLTKKFGMLQDHLRRLANDEDVQNSERVSMGLFFDALGDLFYRDVADISVAIHRTDFERAVV